MKTPKSGPASIECPVCHVAPGKRCFFDPPVPAKIYHNERLALAPLSSIRGVLNRVYIPKGSNPTSACKGGSCQRCNGVHARRYGMPGLACTCSCHKK